MVPAVTVKVALVLPARTVAEEGTVSEELLSETETATPPVGAALEMVTVQVLLAPEAKVAGVQASEESEYETVAGGFNTTVTD